jgi:hypothetical protein
MRNILRRETWLGDLALSLAKWSASRTSGPACGLHSLFMLFSIGRVSTDANALAEVIGKKREARSELGCSHRSRDLVALLAFDGAALPGLKFIEWIDAGATGLARLRRRHVVV